MGAAPLRGDGAGGGRLPGGEPGDPLPGDLPAPGGAEAGVPGIQDRGG